MTQPTADSPDPEPAAPSRAKRSIALLAGVLLAVWLTRGPAWFLTLFANLAHVVGGAALLVLPWSLARRRFRLAAFQIGFALCLSVILGLRWSATPTRLLAAQPDSIDLRIVTYNLGTDLAKGPRLAAELSELDADLVALQELSVANADYLAKALAESHPYRALYPGGIPGRGLFSRYPIVEHEFLDLTQIRKHLICRLEVGGRELTVAVLHLGLTIGVLGANTRAARDLETVLDRVEARQSVLVCGDFNTTANSDVWRRMRARGFSDAFRGAQRGPGFTFPVFGRYHGFPAPPCVRIDYVWHTPDFRARRAFVGADCGSDHRPLVCELNWTGPGSSPR